ncbi:hypothetical protein LY90DRAFT_517082 [Neocallimastix californiae]|uniref:Uncharacterized protein n=1 Tax=Neocallimastix californiae TaxID=1754190 RepID=A0A1Y2AC50_9FUNG|nr:hypothetical protein LY90DRAFT_517082 [Neocallimastix californiae]|eukprot:ORY20081.1 hypothetical protein LY90DRAFT_517082 [Neocallimastix californiae]
MIMNNEFHVSIGYRQMINQINEYLNVMARVFALNYKERKPSKQEFIVFKEEDLNHLEVLTNKSIFEPVGIYAEEFNEVNYMDNPDLPDFDQVNDLLLPYDY